MKTPCPKCQQMSKRHSKRQRKVDGQLVDCYCYYCKRCVRYFTVAPEGAQSNYPASLSAMRVALDSLAAGGTLAAAAKVAGKSVSTVHDWKNKRMAWVSKHLQLTIILSTEACEYHASRLGVEGPVI